jgi:hypothetical protein
MANSDSPPRELEIDDWEYWWHKKSFFRTLIFCALLGAAQLLWIEHIKPAPGHVYERMPTLTGTWWSGHCGNGHTCARVGNTSVSCSVNGYFPFGFGSRGSCGQLDIPNGEEVVAIRVKTPMANNHYSEYLATISSAHTTYKSDDDEKIRLRWINQSRTDVINTFYLLFIIGYFVQWTIYSSKKGK